MALILHKDILGLLGFWEVPVHIFYGDQWPGEVVTVLNVVDPY